MMTFKETMPRLQSLLARIPRGKVTTYKEIARALGMRGFRLAGQLLKNNPEPSRFPCYKVVCSDGHPGGYALGAAEKIKRLKADGIVLQKGHIVPLDRFLFTFNT